MWGLYLLVVILCALFSAFFSCSDLVYGVVDQDKLAHDNSKRAKLALKIAKDYEWSISSILFGNNVVNIIASSFVTLLGIVWGIEAWISIAFGAFLIVFCEFLPKAIAKRFNYPLSKAFAYPIHVLKYVFIICSFL